MLLKLDKLVEWSYNKRFLWRSVVGLFVQAAKENVLVDANHCGHWKWSVHFWRVQFRRQQLASKSKLTMLYRTVAALYTSNMPTWRHLLAYTKGVEYASVTNDKTFCMQLTYINHARLKKDSEVVFRYKFCITYIIYSPKNGSKHKSNKEKTEHVQIATIHVGAKCLRRLHHNPVIAQ